MRIAIDARELCGQVTGVGRYVWHVLQVWDSLPEAQAHEFILFVPAPESPATGAAEALLASLRLANLRVTARGVTGGSGTWWEQVRLPAALRRESPDVLFAPAYTAPVLTSVPVVLTVHDLSFIAHPEWFPPRSRLRRRVITSLAARRARLVLTVSEFQHAEVTSLLGIPADRVRAIRHGFAPVAGGRAVAAAPAAAPGQPCPKPVVLYVGSILNRRHVPELIQAFAEVNRRHPGLRLEIVGDNRTYPGIDVQAVAEAAGVAGQTAVRSFVSDETLADLYSRAGAFVFLSDYEGFGLTPLEALTCGVPVLVGDTPVAHEVYRDAAAFVQTSDVRAIAENIERLLFDAAWRSDLLARAPSVVGRFTWAHTARETLAALVEAARG